MSRRLRTILSMTVLLAFAMLAGEATNLRAQEPAKLGEDVLQIRANLFELPSSRAAIVALHAPARIYWNETPLRFGLQELSRQYHITIWLDRDINPNQLVTTQAAAPEEDSSLRGRLEHIAMTIDADLGLIENVVYLGPKGRVARLQRAAVELHDALSHKTGEVGTTLQREFRWGELATSKELLSLLEMNWKVEFDGELPHDLFHAGEFLQPSTLATQATVVLGGFEREAKWISGDRLRIIPLEQPTEWQANYRKSDIDLRRLVSLKNQYAGSQCQTRGNVSQVLGVTPFHLALLAPEAPTHRPAALGNSAERYEFEVANTPANTVLEHLSKSIGFELDWEPNLSQASRQQNVTFQVKQVTLDQLLAEIARTGNFQIKRQGTKVSIGPPEGE